MAILEAVLTQEMAGQLVVNRFHYVSTGTPAAVTLSFGLLTAMGFLNSRMTGATFELNTLAAQIQNAQAQSVVFKSMAVRDLYSVTDFYETAYTSNIIGQVSGDAMSPAVAIGFYSNRVRTDVRRGQKRFAGVPESSVSNNGMIASTALTQLNGFAYFLGLPLEYDDEGNTITYSPAVLSFEEYTTPSGKRAYRKYATASAQLEHTALGILYTLHNSVRTQTSRQYGRGA
jgi:hypothetical protein